MHQLDILAHTNNYFAIVQYSRLYTFYCVCMINKQIKWENVYNDKINK